MATARALIVGVPLGVGLYAWYAREEERFGVLLILAGGGWFLTALAESRDELPYTLGRAAGWLMELALVYLILAYPSGRLPGRRRPADRAGDGDRRLHDVSAAAAAGRGLRGAEPVHELRAGLPRERLLRPRPGTGVRQGLHEPVGVLLVFAALSLAVARVTRRVRHATLLTRRMIIPVVAVGAARAGAVGVALVARQLDATTQALNVVSWLLVLAAPLMALAFLAGLLRWKLFAGVALERLSGRLRTVPDVPTLRQAFADLFDDPSIEIVSEPPGGRAYRRRGPPRELPKPGQWTRLQPGPQR